MNRKFLAMVATMLVPGIALAQEAAAKKGSSLQSIPGGGYVNTFLGWLQSVVTPDAELWWLWLVCFPLTIVWMIWSSRQMKEAFNNAGGVILFGGLAAVFFLGFYGVPIAVLFKIFGGVTAILGFAMHPSLGGFWDTLVAIFKLIPVFIVIWVLRKIPGIEDAVMKVLGFGKMIATRIWALHDHAKKHPNWGYQAFGAAVIAGAICGSFATNLTLMENPPEVLGVPLVFPGMISVASAAVGVFFLAYRTVFGQRMIARVQHKPGPNGEWVCNGEVYKHTNSGEIFFEEGQLRHYTKLNQALTEGLTPTLVKCKTQNFGEDHSCRSNWCNARNPYLNWECPDSHCSSHTQRSSAPWDCPNPTCDKKDLPHTQQKCTCGARKPEVQKGISYDKSKCPTCGARKPEVKPAPPCTPNTDLYNRQTTEERAAGVAAGQPIPTEAAPAAPEIPVEQAMDGLLTNEFPNQEAANQGVSVCPSCNYHSYVEAVFCEECGTRLPTRLQLETEEVPAPVAAPEQPAQEESEEEPMADNAMWDL